MSQIGISLRTIRLRRGLTQEQLARVADVAHNTIARIEGGSRNPSIGLLHKLAEVLDVPVTDLLAPAADGDEPAARPA